MRQLAACENVVTKVSGLGMVRHDWDVDFIRPIAGACFDIFGVERCLFGSNFPVDGRGLTLAEIASLRPDGVACFFAGAGAAKFIADYATAIAGSMPDSQVWDAIGSGDWLGVPTAVHYPLSLHMQPVFAHLGHREGDFPVSEAAARRVISLPMHPYLTEAQQVQVVDALAQAVA